MKRVLSLLMILFLLCSCNREKPLPLPEVESGMRGELGIDRNINEETIDQYLNRSDTVYRDMRMLKDEADYEAIGGDSYLSGIVEGFEVVPYPYLCNVEGLPEAVGNTYSGVTLFTHTEDGEYVANYEESMHIIESLFPRDKNIFLMCGGGGYAGMTKQLLVGLGYDPNRIYNVGGYWYYKGDHRIETFYEEDGEIHYDFSTIIYHNIDFTTLKKIHESGTEPESDPVNNEDDFIQIENTQELQELEAEKKTFALYVYLPTCSSCASFYPIIDEFVKVNGIQMYAVNLRNVFEDHNSVSERLSYTPSVMIYENGEVKAYLDPGSDEDLPYYKTLEGLTEWFTSHIDLELLKEDCESACKVE